MNAIVHPLKRKKPGRKKGPPTDTATFRMSKEHKETLDEHLPSKQRRPWIEKHIDNLRRKGGRPPKP